MKNISRSALEGYKINSQISLLDKLFNGNRVSKRPQTHHPATTEAKKCHNDFHFFFFIIMNWKPDLNWIEPLLDTIIQMDL